MEPHTEEATETLSQEFNWLLDNTIDRGASDLHISADNAPHLRIDGVLWPLDVPAYTPKKTGDIVSVLIGKHLQHKILSDRKELDFSFSYREQRFRCNVYYSKSALCASLRLLPNKIGSLAELGVPPAAGDMLQHNQGLIIVAGPTGHGKSTTLASMVDLISSNNREHIITIEDPVEFVFAHKKGIVSQREVTVDTPSFASALRAALREDPDVVMVGEMRDLDTVEAALQMAETGHLVLTSLHTNSAAQTAERIINFFPPHQQRQVRQQLADILLGVISQRLLTKIQGGRVLATEIMIANSAVRSMIREGKTHQLNNLIQTSAAEGMVSLEKSLADLVSRGEISLDDAMSWAIDPRNLKTLIY
ncbi:PilT/PilU family type 4a pilus ATPase [Patescibacteria group bacterium]|nr:PilT/PilU family type 4a pilus ATPase [Patescibacteria group bacterium]